MQNPRPERSGVLTVPGEPVTTRWRMQEWAEVAGELMVHAPAAGSRPVLAAVDGRSGAGIRGVAERIVGEVPGGVLLDTDDVARHEAPLAWDHLLAAGILVPLRQGGGVSYRPPTWQQEGRSDSLEVPAGCPLVVVAGTGSSRVGLASLLDATIWVQADEGEALRRVPSRAPQEAAFLAGDRPWDRADLVLCGTPEQVPRAQIEESGPVTVARLLTGTPDPLGDRVLRAVSRDSGPDLCRC